MVKYNRHRFGALFSDLAPGTNHQPEDQLPFNQQDQSPEPEEAPREAEPPPAQDQAVQPGVDDAPFEEAVPLEDELSALLDSID